MSDQPPLSVEDSGSRPRALPLVPSGAVARAFGAENREQLLREYFDRVGGVVPTNAWEHTYRLLLWVDRTTGLAHCYESDKCQPGRPWYARSLAFHGWLAAALGRGPSDVGDEIDYLFKRATGDLVAGAAARRVIIARAAREQLAPYDGQGFPLPGQDSELEGIISEVLAPYLAVPPPADVLRRLTERIQAHVGLENKRKNLVGEGFEDTVAALLRRIPGIAGAYDVKVRPLLHDLPGFHPPKPRDKPRQVDVALVERKTGNRTLVSCKWSVRSDREEQFRTDFAAYADLEADGQDFGYVLVTNEFDPARLAAACDNRRQNALLFTDVVHVNPDGLRAAYGPTPGPPGGGISRALGHADSGRLSSLGHWLTVLKGRIRSP